MYGETSALEARLGARFACEFCRNSLVLQISLIGRDLYELSYLDHSPHLE